MTTGLSILGLPSTKVDSIAAKKAADYPLFGTLVAEFDLWRPEYGNALVYIYRANTTELVTLYSDSAMTQEIANPQRLISYVENGVEYGKFSTHVYSPYAYMMTIEGKHDSGVQLVPLTSLAGEDASSAFVTSKNSTLPRTLEDRFGDVIYAEDYGKIGTIAATNTDTINAAMSAITSNGGGEIILPVGTIPINPINLATGVILKGHGDGITTLTCSSGDEVITLTGNDSGLAYLTLDGVVLNSGSVGVYSVNKQRVILDNVTVKRFATNLYHIGGKDHRYTNLNLDDADTQAKFHGDSNPNSSTSGGSFSGLLWKGGNVAVSTVVGLDFAVVDRACRNNSITGVTFTGNIGSLGAINVYGAQWLKVMQCDWTANTTHVKVADNPDTNLSDREAQGITFENNTFDSGELSFDGYCQDVIFKGCKFAALDFELNVPDNQILLLDCYEDTTTISQETLKLSRARTVNTGNIKGTTTDTTETVVFKKSLNPNEIILVELKVTAEQTNGSGYAGYHYTHCFRCAPADLNYDEQTANFTVGDVITGATSGATAVIASDSDAGATGTLQLGTVVGTFVDNEIITGATSGSAKVNGVLSLNNTAEVGTETEHHAVGSNSGSPPAGWGGVDFAVSEQEAHVTVQGADSININWNIDIKVTVL